jgi:hypothetical protein
VTGEGAPPGEPRARGWLVVRGLEGLLLGDVLLLAAGQEATLGRGSGSTLPLTRCAGYRALSADPARLRTACQGVSRRHFRIAVPAEGEAVVEDLSRAGTFVDGSRLAEPVHLRDLRDRPHGIRFGRGESLEMRWAAAPAPAGGA